MKMLLAVFGCLAAASLAGCDVSTSERLTRMSAKLGGEVMKAVADAKMLQDPWAAHQQLSSNARAIEGRLECFDGAGHRVCAELPDDATAAVRSELLRYESEAIARGDATAIAETFDRLRRYEGKARLAELAPSILDAAKRAKGTMDDIGTFRAAGLMLAAGEAVQRDSNGAVGYLARAWAAGDAQSAGDIAIIFVGMNDLRNAYLWSIRCVGACRRDYRVEVDGLQRRLLPAAVKQAQTGAADLAVVELDTQL